MQLTFLGITGLHMALFISNSSIPSYSFFFSLQSTTVNYDTVELMLIHEVSWNFVRQLEKRLPLHYL